MRIFGGIGGENAPKKWGALSPIVSKQTGKERKSGQKQAQN